MCQITFALQQDRMGWEIVLGEMKEEQDKSLGFTTQNKPEILGFTAYMCLNHHQAYGNNFNLKILIQCRLGSNENYELFYYSVYFDYCLWVSLYFLILFISLAVLF